MGVQDVLTVAGASVLVIILLGAFRSAVPTFDASRFGAIVAILLGVVIVTVFNFLSVTDHLDPATDLLTGILAGASAAGVYDAGRGVTRRA